ncbi:hypothetical protein [Pseudomonas baetica]|uniref:hypothetical protein n=1 Tax=Pseudomonas baetica TaxID=674054 RepID=UPI00240537F3|nr:hypothetical protein [Pseudomonas baetica]MDF9778965.1 hypothetical protein [Pseudomonas baetica]
MSSVYNQQSPHIAAALGLRQVLPITGVLSQVKFSRDCNHAIGTIFGHSPFTDAGQIRTSPITKVYRVANHTIGESRTGSVYVLADFEEGGAHQLQKLCRKLGLPAPSELTAPTAYPINSSGVLQ